MTTKTQTTATLAAFCAASHLNPRLIRAVVRQMGGWESFTESAGDITSHGIDGGFNGFIYNRETEAFAKRNRALIADMAKEQADDLGESVLDMIAGFGCLGGMALRTLRVPSYGDDKIEQSRRRILAKYHEAVGSALYAGKNLKDGENVLNALAWYAGEEVARSYDDLANQ